MPTLCSSCLICTEYSTLTGGRNGVKNSNGIHAIRPGLSVTVPDFDTLSRCPGNYEIPDFLSLNEREGFVINSCLNDKCCICCRVPIFVVYQS